MSSETLQDEYPKCAERAVRLLTAVEKEFTGLLAAQQISLGVPIESRVKEWTSIKSKLERKTLNIERVEDLDDLAGIRAILLFRSDLMPVEHIIRQYI